MVHYCPMTYSFDNWKSVLFDFPHAFCPSPAPTSATTVCSLYL